MLKRIWEFVKGFVGAIKLVAMLPLGMVGTYGFRDLNQFLEDNGLEYTEDGFSEIEA